MVKINRWIMALSGLALAGCLARPAQGPSFISLAGGQVIGAGLWGHLERSTAPGGAVRQAGPPRANVATRTIFSAPARSTVAANSHAGPATPAPTLLAPPAGAVSVAVPAATAAGAALPATIDPQPTLAAPAAQRVPILEYHYTSFAMLPTVMMRPEWFQAQMQWLAQAGFHSLSSAELAGFVAGAQPAPARSVALSFDVGASHFDEYTADIIPSLRRNHLRAIFFVMPSQTRDTCDGHIACWPSLLAWQAEGLISIESHSFMHEDYATLGPERLAFDIAHSKAAIEAKTGRPVLGLCYPFDSVAPAALDLLARAGYRYAVAGGTRRDRSARWNDPQPFALPRYYPYSGAASYPLIGGPRGMTFEQMLLGAAENGL